MSWSGGTFTRANGTTGWADDEANSIGIESGRHDASDNDLATGINSCLNKDGSNAATANLNFGGFRATNAGAATARTDLARTSQVQDSSLIFAGDTGGSATAYTATLAPAITGISPGQRYRINAHTDSSGTAPTISFNGLTAITICRQDLSDLEPRDMVGNRIYDLIYNGAVSKFALQNPTPQPVSWTPTISSNDGSTGSTSATASYVRTPTNRIDFTVEFTTTLSGSVGGAEFSLTLPKAASNQHATFVGSEVMGAGNTPNLICGRLTSTTEIFLVRVGPVSSSVGWSNGTYTIRVSGSYPSA